jgi:hypothetical protein
LATFASAVFWESSLWAVLPKIGKVTYSPNGEPPGSKLVLPFVTGLTVWSGLGTVRTSVLLPAEPTG